MNRGAALACAIALLLAPGVAARADESAAAARAALAHEMGEDRFLAGDAPASTTATTGHLLAAGGRVDVLAPVGRDAALAAGEIRVNAAVGEDLYAAAGRIDLAGTVGRSARLAGGQVELGPASVVKGGVSVAGGEVRLLGRVDGYVQATGGSILINGPIDGDVELRAGQVELGPAARVGGKLRYASRRPILQSASATVAGGIERVTPESGWPVPADFEDRIGRAGSWIWSIGILLLALVLVAAVPGAVAAVAQLGRARPGLSALVGFVCVACAPVAAIILFVTLVGVPLGLLLLMVVATLLVAGYAVSGIALGEWILRRVPGAAGLSTTSRLMAAALGVLLLSLLARIPFLGGIVMLTALVTGAGAIVLASSQALRRPPPAAPAA